MNNLFSGVPDRSGDRLTTIKQSVAEYGKEGVSKEEPSYDSSGEIGDESPPKGKLLGRKKDDEEGGSLASLLNKIFGKAGLEVPESIKEFEAHYDKKEGKTGSDDDKFSYSDKPRGKGGEDTYSYSDDEPKQHQFPRFVNHLPVILRHPDDKPEVKGDGKPEAKDDKKPEPKEDKPVPHMAKIDLPPPPPPEPVANEKTGKPVDGEKRPDSDKRSADEIINDNPVLKNLGDQKDIQRDKLKQRCGDWTEDNKDPKSRADAAWKMAHVLNWIDNSKTADGNEIKDAGNGDITGITSSGDARHGTKAGLLKDFGDQGYPAIKGDQTLDHTNDSHVRPDGTNKDNLEWVGDKIKDGFIKFGDMIKDGFIKVGNAFVKLGDDIKNGFIHFGEMVKHGFKGIGDAIRGDTDAQEKEFAEARDNGKKLGDDIVDGFKQIGTIAEELGPMLLDAIPGVGVELSVAVMAAKFGAEMALKAGLKAGTKEFTEMALQEGGKELAKGTVKAGAKEAGKEGGKDAGSEIYNDTTGETPQQTKDRLEAEAKAKGEKALA